jgi:hypothetical protein
MSTSLKALPRGGGMTEQEQIRHICLWNRRLARENRELRQALQQSRQAAAEIGVERETALIFLNATWQAATEGRRP